MCQCSAHSCHPHAIHGERLIVSRRISVPRFVPFRVSLRHFALLFPLQPVFSPEPLLPCGQRQGKHTLRLRQLRSLALWQKSLLLHFRQAFLCCLFPRGFLPVLCGARLRRLFMCGARFCGASSFVPCDALPRWAFVGNACRRHTSSLVRAKTMLKSELERMSKTCRRVTIPVCALVGAGVMTKGSGDGATGVKGLIRHFRAFRVRLLVCDR